MRTRQQQGIILLIVWGCLGTIVRGQGAPEPARDPWTWIADGVKGFVGAPLDPRRPQVPPAYPGAEKRKAAVEQRAAQMAAQAPSTTGTDQQPDPTWTAVKRWVGKPLDPRERSEIARKRRGQPQPVPTDERFLNPNQPLAQSRGLEPVTRTSQSAQGQDNASWSEIEEWKPLTGQPPQTTSAGASSRGAWRLKPVAMGESGRGLRPAAPHDPRVRRLPSMGFGQPSFEEPARAEDERRIREPLDRPIRRASATQSSRRTRAPRTWSKADSSNPDFESRRSVQPEVAAPSPAADGSAAELPEHLTIMHELLHGKSSRSRPPR